MPSPLVPYEDSPGHTTDRDRLNVRESTFTQQEQLRRQQAREAQQARRPASKTRLSPPDLLQRFLSRAGPATRSPAPADSDTVVSRPRSQSSPSGGRRTSRGNKTAGKTWMQNGSRMSAGQWVRSFSRPPARVRHDAAVCFRRFDSSCLARVPPLDCLVIAFSSLSAVPVPLWGTPSPSSSF